MSTFYFGQELRVFLQVQSTGAYYEIPVIAPPTFAQQSEIQTITTDSMPGGGDSFVGHHQTHAESFETSLSDVTFNLSTHIRPYQDSNVENAVEAALWSFLTDPNTGPTPSATSLNIPQFVLEDPVNKFNLYLIYGLGTGALPGYKISNCVLDSANMGLGKGNVNAIAWAGKGTSVEQTTLNVGGLTIVNSAGVAKTDNYISTDKLSYMESNGLTQSFDGGDFQQGNGHFGRSVSLSGNVLGIGQHWMDNPLAHGVNALPGPPYVYDGGAHIYSTQDEGRNWTLEGILSTPPTLDDETYTFAGNVVVEGNHIAIGGYGYQGAAGNDVGGVATYTREFLDGNVRFLPGGKILKSFQANAAYDYFGMSLDIYEDWMIVGASGYDFSDISESTASANNGLIEFWKYDNGWNFHSLVLGNLGAGHYFGRDVCIHGNHAVAMANGDLTFLYRNPTTDAWTISQQVSSISGTYNPDVEIDPISMSENYAVIGQGGFDSSPHTDLGRVTIWKLTGTPGASNAWTVFQTLGPAETNVAHRPRDRFGSANHVVSSLSFGDSTAIDPVTESTIVVGARMHSLNFSQAVQNETGAGAAWVFKLNEEGTAFEFAKRLDNSNLSAGQGAQNSGVNNNFGLSVAAHNDIVAIGSPEEDAPTHRSQNFSWYDGDGNPVNHTVTVGGVTKHVLRVDKHSSTYISGTEEAYPRHGGRFTLGGIDYYLHNNSTDTDYHTADYRSFEVSVAAGFYDQDTTQSGNYIGGSVATVLTQSQLAALVSANSLSSSVKVDIFERQEGRAHTYKLSDTTLSVNGLLPVIEASVQFSYPTQSITYPILGEVTSTLDYKRGPLQIQGNISGFIFNSDDQRDAQDFISNLLSARNQHTDLEFYLGGREESTNRVRMHFPRCILGKPEISTGGAATYKVSFIAESTNPLGNSTNTSNAVSIEYLSSSSSTRA
tara:strand:- start:21737 stop:24565 length:2829 start_codon:yes stop_codon:yes gene_type:complete